MKTAMDRFDLKLFDVSDGEQECWNGMLLLEGEPIFSYEDYSVNWHQLVSSLVEPGQYLIFTCTCGDADCAGIGQRNVVTHHDSFFRWEMKQPSPKPVLEFDRDDAIRRTLEILSEIRSFVPAADYGTNFPVLPVLFSDGYLDWCVRTLRTGKIEGSPWADLTASAIVPLAKRDVHYLQREVDRPLPSDRWIRRLPALPALPKHPASG